MKWPGRRIKEREVGLRGEMGGMYSADSLGVAQPPPEETPEVAVTSEALRR